MIHHSVSCNRSEKMRFYFQHSDPYEGTFMAITVQNVIKVCFQYIPNTVCNIHGNLHIIGRERN
jgi:hypothetical protein